jgi:beta-lactam-binding protein with PASTA domain
MRVRITLGRVVAFIVLCALVFVAVTIAIIRDGSSESKRKVKISPPPTKVVPGVIGQPYVFAESTLQQAGFGWKVVGSVAGWAGVTVSSQTPAPGTKVVDTGAPLVTLRLVKPKGYVTQGTPENSSPYAGTKIMLSASSTGTGQSTTSAQTTTTGTFSTTTVKKTSRSTTSQAETRPPAFTIAGAKSEPLDEIPLLQRAKNLSTWLDSHRQASAASERYWLFQHAWIVTGAKFGWWHGAQALEILIAVDKRVEALWGMGAASEREARQALAYVEERSK